MRLSSRSLFLVVLAAAVAIPAARALSVIPPTFEQLVSMADVVVDGEVTGVRSELSSFEGRPLVYTFVSIRVLDALKGTPGETVELRMLGGTAGDVTLQVSGVPKFQVGERNLFFIEGNGLNFCPLVAVPHGYYPIAEREADGVKVVLRSNGMPLEDPAEVVESMHHGAHATGERHGLGDAMTVSDFKNRIRAEVTNARQQ